MCVLFTFVLMINMKELSWKLVLPLTIISFFVFTKWWYVLPVDGPDTMMSGFPLIWVSDGWHTSLSLQIFVTEFIIDISVYFLFWFAVVFTFNRFILVIKVPRIITIFLLGLATLICTFAFFIGTMPEHIYLRKRDFDIEVLTTGYKFIWEHQDRPNYHDYKPRNN